MNPDPLLDRINIHMEVIPVPYRKLTFLSDNLFVCIQNKHLYVSLEIVALRHFRDAKMMHIE
jgi:hypothetical protein